MPTALLETKFYVPRPRLGLVPRPRLRERLDRAAASKLMLVSAPAGFGKTTLLAEWLAAGPAAPADERSAAWLSLDQGDNDPASFWRYVIAALQTVAPRVGASALGLLQAPQPPPIETVLTTLLNDLGAVASGVVLVLDDYHVIDAREVQDAMAFLLDHLPPQLHLVIASRADPAMPLARLRARGELVEIRAAELRFTPDEAAAYLNEVTGLDLAAEDIAALEERTEGWIAALQLAALSLQGRDDVSGFIARFAGDDRYIVDYLVEEVLRDQPDEVRDFLLQSAILDRLTGPLCDAVTGRDDGSDMVVALERANLFVVALDDRREWYRYHHLFADVLRARLLAEQPDLVPLLHKRASRWYEAHDSAEEAVRHALAARDFDRAAYLIELAVSEIRRHRQDAMMYGWLKALPDDAVRRSPVLGVFYGSMLLLSGDLDAVGPRLDDAERALAAVPEGSALPWADTDDLHTLPATIAIYRASLAQARGDAAGTAEHARRALDLAGAGDHLARGGAAGFLGLAAWAQGDVTTALETFRQAVTSLHAAGSLVDELSGTVLLADMELAAGRPSKSRRLLDRALQLAEARGESVSRATAELHVGLSEMDVEVDDLESAKRHLEAAAALADRVGMTESRYRWFVASGLLARADGDFGEALDLLDQAEQLFRPGFYPDVRPIAAMKARIWMAQGKLSEAADWARERGVSPTDEASYLREYDHLTLVRLLLARHRAHEDARAADEAVGLLARLHEAAERTGRDGSLLEIRMLQALAHDALGRRQEAVDSLSQALALAPEPEGYVRLFLGEGAPMIGLLRDARDKGVETDQAHRLLSFGASPEAEAPDSGPRPAPSSPDRLSERERQVLRLLDSELSGPQIARELFVSHNTLRTHTKHIFTKLDVTSRRAAVRRARERGLI